MRRLFLFLLCLCPLFVRGANIDYRALSTNDFFTNRPSANYVSVNTNRFPSATTITNMILNNLTGGAATNVVVRASTNIFITTNGPTDWTFATTPPLWTNVPSSADIVNTNWYQNVNVIAASLVVSNGGSVGGPLTILDIRNTNNSRILLRSIGEVAGGAQQKIFQYLDGGVENIVFMNDGDLAKLRGVNMHWPTTNGTSGQVLAQDGANPQNWYYTNLFVGTLTNGSSSFWATNVSGTNATFITINATTNFVTQLFPTNINGVPTTNFIQSIATNVANSLRGIGPGTLNQIALFGTTTTNVTNSVIAQINTNMIALIQDYDNTHTYTNAATNRIYGKWTSSTVWEALDLIPATINDLNQIRGNVGSGDQSGIAGGIGISGLTLNNSWTVNPPTPKLGQGAYYILPTADNVGQIGTSVSRVFRIAMGTGSIYFTGVPGDIPNTVNNNWGIAYNTTNLSFYRDVTGTPTLSSRFSSVSPVGTLGWDFGANVLGLSSGGVGANIAFIKGSTSANLGEIQFHTNNAGATTGPRAILTGSIGTGSDHGGGSVDLRGSYGTGSARNGDVTISTAPGVAGSSSTANNSYITNFYVASQFVTLTESTPTLVFNVAVASGKVIAFKVEASTFASDGTDHQIQFDDFSVVAENKAGTVTATLSSLANSHTNQVVSAGTLQSSWTAVVNGNGVDVKNTAISSLTQTTLQVLGGYTVHLMGNSTSVISPQ